MPKEIANVTVVFDWAKEGPTFSRVNYVVQESTAPELNRSSSIEVFDFNPSDTLIETKTAVENAIKAKEGI